MLKRILIAVALILLVVPAIIVAVLAYTQTGVELLAGQLERLERAGIHIDGISGTLAGPLHIERFELNHPRMHVISNDIVINLDLRGLLLRTLQTSQLTARDSSVELRDTETPPNTKPLRFLPGFLRIDARGIDLAGVRYVHLNGTEVDIDRIRGRITVTSRRLRVRELQVDAKQFNVAGDVRLDAAKAMGVRANVNGRLRMERGTELALSSQVGGTLDRLAIQAQMQQPGTASLEALFTRPDGKWHIAGRLTAASLDLSPWMDKPPFSLRNVKLDAQAGPDEIRIAGNIGIPELDRNDLTIDARGRYADRSLHLASADIALNDTPARLHVEGTVALDGGAPTLDIAARWISLQWPLHDDAMFTSASGDAHLRGTLPYDFTITAEIDGPKLPQAQGLIQGVLSKEQVQIASYAVNSFGGSLTGDATLQFAAPRAWKFSTNAKGVDPVELHRQFPGSINLVANGEGRGLDKKASFTVNVGDLHGTLRSQPINGRGTVQRDSRGWVVRGANVGYGGARLSLDATLRDIIDARWSLNAPALQKVLPDAAGALEFDGTASGPLKSPHVVANLHASDIRYQQWLAKRVSLTADIDAAGGSPSQLAVQAQQLGHGQPLIETLNLTGSGFAADHQIGIEMTGQPPNPEAPAPQAKLQVAGSYVEQIWNATITTTQLTRGDPNENLSIIDPAKVVVSREQASLDNLCLAAGAGRLCAAGKWQRNGPWEGTVSGYEIPLASLLPPAGEQAEYAGRIEGRVHAFGAPGQPWQGDAGMRIIDAAIIYRPVGAEPETLNLGTGGLGAKATPERIDLSFGVQAFTDTYLHANAHLLRDGSNNLMTMPLTADLRARAADANILPLLFPDIDNAAGVLTANANITGTPARPEVNGRIELANGEFDSYRVNLSLRELSVIAELAANGLDFRGSGRAGDGRLDLDGRFTWVKGESNGSMHLRGQNLLVADLPEYRVVASPDLHFQIEGRHMNASGDVLIPSARIQPQNIAGAVRASSDARYVGEHPAERAGRFVVNSEIRIGMGDEVRVDAFGLHGQIVGSVGTTIRTGQTPIGRGELSVDEGRYEAYGQNLEISRGRLLFEASPLDDPGLDIEARRRIESTTVGLNVRGTLQEPRLTLFSDPSMPQTQILAYLLTGKSMDSMSGSDATTVQSASNALAMQGGGALVGQLGRRLGLEQVGVESTVDSAGEATRSLVLGKFLSPRLFISYGISLTESVNTLKLRYTISDRWVLRTESGEEQSADLEFTVER